MALGKLSITRKQVADQLIASMRYQGDLRHIGPVLERLAKQCRDYICGPAIIIYRRGTGIKDGFDMDVCYPVTQIVETDEVRSSTLQGGDVLSVLHCGPHSTLAETWEALFDYIEKNNIVVEGPGREIYLESSGEHPHRYVTELQVPCSPPCS